MKTYTIAVIPGDGIGKEVVPEGLRVLEAAGRRFGINYSFTHYDWSCETYAKTGRMMPADGLAQLRPYDAIFLGAVGYPGVPDHISLWGLLIPIRRSFEQYVNLRPVRLLKGVDSPLKNAKPGEIDFCVVRENCEGEYSNIGGRIYTKSNGIIHTMPYWDERFAALSKEYPDVRTDQFHIDILSAHFVRRPEFFDVVVGSNLFGDILSDLGPAVVGSIGIAPSANLNPQKKYPSMFEPVHGSAPDIAGKNIANPIGQIWSAAMMLAHFGEQKAADAIERAIENVLTKPEYLTPDLGGKATTQIVGKAIADNLG
jgi:tartrate dehydrogenase/decarboxylase / D-malate dehydrogenase